jgi:hypothetical protein
MENHSNMDLKILLRLILLMGASGVLLENLWVTLALWSVTCFRMSSGKETAMLYVI